MMAEKTRHSYLFSASTRVNAEVRERQNTDAYLNDPMMKMKWYHPFLTRHAAECMLIDNAPEGAYLLRPSTTGQQDEYALSVKFSQSVQHMKVICLPNDRYRFGQSSFDSVSALKRHFELEKPIVGGESGINVVLKYPYSRDIDEQHLYTNIHHHAVTNMIDPATDSDSESDVSDDSWQNLEGTLRQRPYITPVSSREGYLTKLGRIRKTWKVRWFILRNTSLSYYKTKQSSKPIRVINMLDAIAVEYDETIGKDFSFRIVFPSRTFHIYANSNEDCDQWVELLSSKILTRQERPHQTTKDLQDTSTRF